MKTTDIRTLLSCAVAAALLAPATISLGAAPAEAAEALPIAPAPGAREDTRAYAGIVFSFGNEARASVGVVVGVQHTRVRRNNTLRGVDLNARWDFTRGFDRIALAGLVGSRDLYANVGAGFRPTSGEVFATAAGQTRHLRIGGDFAFSGAFEGFGEVNSLTRLRRPAAPAAPPPGEDDIAREAAK